jgi:hypothetical protein
VKKISILMFFIIVLLFLCNSIGFCDEESVVALSGHELGDQIFALRAGMIIPLFFHDFEDDITVYDSNSTLGACGALQWSFYLMSALRVGIDLNLAFSLDPNMNLYNMIPLTANITYIFAVSRFEFPVSLSAGINILNFGDFYNLGFILKPSIAANWRYDANLSFGLNIGYWWVVEAAKGDYPPVAGNFLDITPSIFYHF